MKNWIVFMALTGVFFTSCQTEKEKGDETSSEMIDNDNPPTMDFEETSHNFGTISQGETVKHTFFFKNTGKTPLLIQSAQGSCGCTIPTWPKDPIAPGDEGKIEVSFNSEYKKGHQEKLVTILANTKPIKTILKMIGEVSVPDEK